MTKILRIDFCPNLETQQRAGSSTDESNGGALTSSTVKFARHVLIFGFFTCHVQTLYHPLTFLLYHVHILSYRIKTRAQVTG